MTVSLLPHNATTLEQSLERAAARIECVPHHLDILWDPHVCPVSMLSWLAWALSVDDWNPEWPEKVQRQVIASTLEIHRVKGAPGAVRLALEALGWNDVRIVEWFAMEPHGRPYTFRADIAAGGEATTPDDFISLFAAIRNAKNLRSHLSGVRITRQCRGDVPKIAFGLQGSLAVTIRPVLPDAVSFDRPVYLGGAVRAVAVVRIPPPDPVLTATVGVVITLRITLPAEETDV